MTPLPKRRHSTRRSGKRRASQKIGLPNLSACSNCGALKPAHQVCPKCGYYNDKPVLKK
ncbi:50S ribosomal protein L32 [Candidatus Shapirobacteria bacterium CG08_land_8_20_14_0_20_39_18]|uniref:Large ribosomal subunit protein bL32 n=1 Tax=Candidatus Shapirobacteria bacterium CG08_land_8_20_14_0_20_39_18 TaxID=1974883 RepID=A0A2M6XDB2_9BACT|nr:MAG: 50S ribosomal protein L32 [Candidatus Shapirobacteria bacterium CG08_land_8_20_14_0_20_39_18]PIY66173.1 MAG: 50S ribosomal protein L32 [Candidatus Shapirobacteria bacterium CG_4_10_14_0_8_um_filter_39_15]PJE68520.1 MAG: 50S ribosomal protein L32 [Candidatus Shapirobacteria bacterium CG10_big_fil_rev_8_21_14_0_10_38_8]